MNEASEDLSKLGEEALDAIEAVAGEREELFLDSSISLYPNTTCVMIAYVRIAGRLKAHCRLIAFLNSLSKFLRVELLGAIFLVWCRDRGAPGIPEEMRPALELRRSAKIRIEGRHLSMILDYDPSQNV